MIVNAAEVVAVCPLAVTVIAPLAAPEGTTAVRYPPEGTSKLVAATCVPFAPVKLTAVVPTRYFPWSTIVSPTLAELVNKATCGVGEARPRLTLKMVPLESLSPAVVP